ncbi:MAG: hypothetical protein J6T10_24545 [Methanobrevibacter sp.]|nr:hypothetical protein [Methanobrevibacter sp.]
MSGEYISKEKIRGLIGELDKELIEIDYHDIKDKDEREYYKKVYFQVVAQKNILLRIIRDDEV